MTKYWLPNTTICADCAAPLDGAAAYYGLINQLGQHALCPRCARARAARLWSPEAAIDAARAIVQAHQARLWGATPC